MDYLPVYLGEVAVYLDAMGIVKMVISNPEGLGFHESPLDHMEEKDSLLYTMSEFEACNKYLHAS